MTRALAKRGGIARAMSSARRHLQGVGRLAVVFLATAGPMAAQEEQFVVDVDLSDYLQVVDASPETVAEIVIPAPDLRLARRGEGLALPTPPLEVLVESASVITVDRPILFLEVRVRNIGEEPIAIPVSLDETQVLSPMNGGRLKYAFAVLFETTESQFLGRATPAITTVGAQTAAGTLRDLQPGNSVLFRFPMLAFSYFDWVVADTVRQVDVHVTLRELPLEDAGDPGERTQVLREATGTLRSVNAVRINWP